MLNAEGAWYAVKKEEKATQVNRLENGKKVLKSAGLRRGKGVKGGDRKVCAEELSWRGFHSSHGGRRKKKEGEGLAGGIEVKRQPTSENSASSASLFGGAATPHCACRHHFGSFRASVRRHPCTATVEGGTGGRLK